MITPVVIDASVILKWVLPPDSEPNQPQALSLAEALAINKMTSGPAGYSIKKLSSPTPG